MSFLPEDDREYLASKNIPHELVTERTPEGTDRRGVLFPGFNFVGNLHMAQTSGLTACTRCDLLILIPQGYPTTQLDSFYTSPILKRPDGLFPHCAAGENNLFNRVWQFWSRHLAANDWRTGLDGIGTFLAYIRRELRVA